MSQEEKRVMDAVSAETFWSWAVVSGIGFDLRHPEARCLTFVPPRHARFWTLPGDPATWPHFVSSILDGLDSWSRGFMWPRCGEWPAAVTRSSYNERVRTVVLRGAGVPDAWAGALRFERGEQDLIAAIAFVYLAFGWCVDDDLYFVPDHGQQVVQTDHHDVIHVECKDERRMEEFVGHMSEGGYELPTAPPDPTFRWPAWMKGRPS